MATLTPGQVPRFLDKVLDEGERDLERIVRDVATDLDETLVTSTRVDTGAARSNWVASMGVPFAGVLPPYNPGRKGSTAGNNAAAALAQGQSIIRNYRNGDALYIVNNIHYIVKLNSGSATNTPDLMFEKGLQSVRLSIRKAQFMRKGVRFRSFTSRS